MASIPCSSCRDDIPKEANFCPGCGSEKKHIGNDKRRKTQDDERGRWAEGTRYIYSEYKKCYFWRAVLALKKFATEDEDFFVTPKTCGIHALQNSDLVGTATPDGSA